MNLRLLFVRKIGVLLLFWTLIHRLSISSLSHLLTTVARDLLTSLVANLRCCTGLWCRLSIFRVLWVHRDIGHVLLLPLLLLLLLRARFKLRAHRIC